MSTSQDKPVGHRYYDLDDILAMNTTITCTVFNTVDKGIFSLLGLPTPDVIDNKGVKIGVPLFMLKNVKEHCEINLPQAYNDAVQQVLSANAATVDLGKLQQYFYYVGIHLADLIERDEGKKISQCLLDTLVKRIGGVVSKGLQGHTKAEKMDNMEKALFDDILVWRRELEDWMGSGSTSSNKRKYPS